MASKYCFACLVSPDDDVPDHSSATRIRDRLDEEVVESVFREIVALCRKKGLVNDECRMITDANLIAADAAPYSLVHNDPEQAREEAEALRGRTKSVDRPASHKISIRPIPTLRWPKNDVPRDN